MQLAGDRGWGLAQTRHYARLCKYAAGKCRGDANPKSKENNAFGQGLTLRPQLTATAHKTNTLHQSSHHCCQSTNNSSTDTGYVVVWSSIL
jgi:hypothetical protein